MIQFYTPEWFIYPIIFVAIFLIGVLITKGHPGYMLVILIAEIIFWVIMYVLLSIMKSYGWLPCVTLLGNLIGGCI